ALGVRAAGAAAPLLGGRARAGLPGGRDRAEPPQPPSAQARRLRIECDLFARLDTVGEARLDLGERDRGRQQDARLRGAADDLGRREIRLARQRRRGIDIWAAPLGEPERPTAPPPPLCESLPVAPPPP